MSNVSYGIQLKKSVLLFSSSLSVTFRKTLNLAQILASASYDDTIKLYVDDPSEDWYCFTTLTGHASTVWTLAFSPNGRFLASGSDDRTIRIWERVAEYKWECVSVIEEHERAVYSISWGRGKGRGKGKGRAGDDGDEENLGWLASTGGDGTILIWELSVSGVDFSCLMCSLHVRFCLLLSPLRNLWMEQKARYLIAASRNSQRHTACST